MSYMIGWSRNSYLGFLVMNLKGGYLAWLCFFIVVIFSYSGVDGK